MHIIHNWSKWRLYEQPYSYVPGRLAPKEMQGKHFDAVDLRQRRFCLDCGKTEDELVVENVGMGTINEKK